MKLLIIFLLSCAIAGFGTKTLKKRECFNSNCINEHQKKPTYFKNGHHFCIEECFKEYKEKK